MKTKTNSKTHSLTVPAEALVYHATVPGADESRWECHGVHAIPCPFCGREIAETVWYDHDWFGELACHLAAHHVGWVSNDQEAWQFICLLCGSKMRHAGGQLRSVSMAKHLRQECLLRLAQYDPKVMLVPLSE